MAQVHNFAHRDKQVETSIANAKVKHLQRRLTRLQQAESIAQLLLVRHDNPELEQKFYEIQAARLAIVQQLRNVADAC